MEQNLAEQETEELFSTDYVPLSVYSIRIETFYFDTMGGGRIKKMPRIEEASEENSAAQELVSDKNNVTAPDQAEEKYLLKEDPDSSPECVQLPEETSQLSSPKTIEKQAEYVAAQEEAQSPVPLNEISVDTENDKKEPIHEHQPVSPYKSDLIQTFLEEEIKTEEANHESTQKFTEEEIKCECDQN